MGERERYTEQRRGNDLVLDPRQFAYVLDETKGEVAVYVGPSATSLSSTDRPVRYHEGAFERTASVQDAVCQFPVAAEGDYIELENPSDGGSTHPKQGKQSPVTLAMGRRVNLPGPVSFALWPGQVVRVIPGHHLRSNQYLIARIYNEEEARKNLGQMVARPTGEGSKTKDEETTASVQARIEKSLTMGQLLVIKGTETSFFIPPTGIEVLADERGEEASNKGDPYVRDAVSLEALEYCVLVDESGKKRFEHGPSVVFPMPTERFRRSEGRDGGQGSRKFKAIELNEISGLHLKVVADYKDEGGKQHKEGDELFVTGNEQRIYFPRPEHAIIRYGEGDGRIFAVAIPEGEGRYVMDRLSGEVNLVTGPKMLLADPRKEVIIRRILDGGTCGLWFPGNQDAIVHNTKLAEAAAMANAEEKPGGGVSENAFRNIMAFAAAEGPQSLVGSELGSPMSMVHRAAQRIMVKAVQPSREERSEHASNDFAGDEVTRRTTYTTPRTLVLDTKYDGAVLIDVWTGYAVLVKSKTGRREVIVGPQAHLLQYDETLEVLSLSSGKPKNTDKLVRTVYLRVKNNQVGDIIKAETIDLVPVEIKTSYRIHFEGDEPSRWFDVENYVKLVCDRCRSIVRSKLKSIKVEDLMGDSVTLVRNMLLGQPQEAEGDVPHKQRPGLSFEECNCRIYDVEVLDLKVGDGEVDKLLRTARHEAITQEVTLNRERAKLKSTEETERIARAVAEAKALTGKKKHDLDLDDVRNANTRALLTVQGEAEVKEARLEIFKAEDAIKDYEHDGGLTRSRREAEQQNSITSAERTSSLLYEKARAEQETEVIAARSRIKVDEAAGLASAVKEELTAMSPSLVAALQTHGDKLVTALIIKKMAPIAAITGETATDAGRRILKGSVLGEVLEAMSKGGASSFAPLARAVDEKE